MKQSCFPPYRGFAALDIGALVRNFCLLREKAQETGRGTRVIAVVKANAYGHGMAQVLPALARVGCDFFAVATPDEALEARRLCKDADVLVLGYTPPACAVALAEANITQTVFSAAYGDLYKNSPLCRFLFDLGPYSNVDFADGAYRSYPRVAEVYYSAGYGTAAFACSTFAC